MVTLRPVPHVETIILCLSCRRWRSNNGDSICFFALGPKGAYEQKHEICFRLDSIAPAPSTLAPCELACSGKPLDAAHKSRGELRKPSHQLIWWRRHLHPRRRHRSGFLLERGAGCTVRSLLSGGKGSQPQEKGARSDWWRKRHEQLCSN